MLNTSLNNFLSEINMKDVLKAISETHCGRMMSYKQINFIKTDKPLNIYVCIKRRTKMIVCLHCHEPVTSRQVLFTGLIQLKINGDSYENLGKTARK